VPSAVRAVNRLREPNRSEQARNVYRRPCTVISDMQYSTIILSASLEEVQGVASSNVNVLDSACCETESIEHLQECSSQTSETNPSPTVLFPCTRMHSAFAAQDPMGSISVT
jgi:hypothetical protein